MAHAILETIYRHKHALHMTQYALLALTIILAIARVAIKGSPLTRAHTYILAVVCSIKPLPKFRLQQTPVSLTFTTVW